VKRAWQIVVVMLLLAMQAVPAFACLLPGGTASSDCCCPQEGTSACQDCSQCTGGTEAQGRCCAPVTSSTFALSRLTASNIDVPASFDSDHARIAAVLPIVLIALSVAADSESERTSRRFDEPEPAPDRPPYLLFERLTL
jgi:hypothetical protein